MPLLEKLEIVRDEELPLPFLLQNVRGEKKKKKKPTAGKEKSVQQKIISVRVKN